jgi:glycosyltransferase involved in cell wall biosynthesis
MLAREARHVDAFIAKSEFSRDKHRALGFSRDMEVIPYFLPDVAPQAKTKPPHERPYFLFVGRLEKMKGVQDIIPAFAGEEGADLLIAGVGQYEQTLKDQARCHPRVKFLGRLAPEALPAYYEHASALIVPSLCYETFGIIMIEAFRMGTPVLARRLGPFPEIIAKGGGLLFDGTHDLRAAINAVQSDGNYRETLSRGARQAFLQNWTDQIVLNRYVDLISKLAWDRGLKHVSAAVGG